MSEKIEREQWAAAQYNLGNTYLKLPTDDRGENLKQAINYYNAALRVYSEAEYPLQWAMTQNNLGVAYGDLPTGDRGENLKQAIDYYKAALRVYSEAEYPLDWAETQGNLGNIYKSQSDLGDTTALTAAIRALKNAERGFLAGGITKKADQAARLAKDIGWDSVRKLLKGLINEM